MTNIVTKRDNPKTKTMTKQDMTQATQPPVHPVEPWLFVRLRKNCMLYAGVNEVHTLHVHMYM